MEELEAHDWNVLPRTPNQERRLNSIKAYWLDRWYPCVADWTFETRFYEQLPDRLPWPSMVRYESQSPKDSEHWGPVQTKDQAERLFATSLRCARWPYGDQGRRLICIRRWTEIGSEFRCFWNGRITAIAGEEKPPLALLSYLVKLALHIPFYRCVLDVAQLGADFVLIEFNSWETNSGAHLFDWKDDHELLYGAGDSITVRWPNGQDTLTWPLMSTLPREPLSDIPVGEVTPLLPNKPSNWLLHKGQLIVSSDVWLAVIDQLEPLHARYWRRGCFRFCHLEPTVDGFCAGDQHYWMDLTPKKASAVIAIQGDHYPDPPFKYGFVAKWRDSLVFCRFCVDRLVPVLL